MISSLRRLPVLVIFLAGCSGDGIPSPETPEGSPRPAFSNRFDPASTGGISGQVVWTDPLPAVGPISYTIARDNGQGLETRTAQNPNRPQIDGKTRAVANAVVYLRKIDQAAAEPGGFEPVTVEIGEAGILVRQGDRAGRTGFVRLGDEATFVSTEPTFHILRARGDDYFSLTMPSPNDSVRRKLSKPGRLEFSSGTGLTWMRADLFVCEHPYYTLTDATGSFAFEQVPVGPAQVVVYLPNWQAGTPLREPESTIIARRTYAPPFERSTSVVVVKNQTATLQISLP